MKLPNKLISYSNSVISKFEILLNELSKEEISPNTLYDKVRNKFDDINEFVETLDCLYYLKKIKLTVEGRLQIC